MANQTPVYIGWLLMGIAVFLLVCIFLYAYVFKIKLWPNRDSWVATFKHNGNTMRVNETLSKDDRNILISPEPQTDGDEYTISFGKYRVIDGIEFYESIPTNEFPHRWMLDLIDEWGANVQRPIIGMDKRIVEEFPPIKVYGIRVAISEPRMKGNDTPYHWRIERVYIREVKLFGHWLRRKI